MPVDKAWLIWTGFLGTNPKTEFGVVDDNATNLRIFEEILKSWKMSPTVVSDGKSALEALERAHAAGQPFPVVLLDCMMPEMDGFQVAARVRANPNLTGSRLVMVSSAANPDDAEKCQQYGIVRYVLKPVVQSELLDTILSTMSGTATDSGMSKSAAKEQDHKVRPLDILLAEDGIVNQKLAVGILKGDRVVIADNGRKAVEFMEKQHFDLVLMDVQMPELDGLEATPLIREREQQTERHTPIIAMTAAAMTGDREQTCNCG